jgi:hypothetical protein
VNVILGDARVQLDAGRKQPGQLTPVTLSSGSREIANGKDNVNRYGMIVLDAFGSDSVPIHLLTEEAIQLYLDRLDENGLLAIHISSKFMNFAPVGAAFSDAFGLHSAIRTDSHVTVEQQQAGRSPSRYMIFSRDKNLIQRFIDLDKGWQTLKSERPIRWTDEHANILDVMVW